MVVSGIRHNLNGTYIEQRKCCFRSGLGATQHDLADVIAMNLVGLLSGIVGALLGAIAGHRFYSTRSEKVASTN